MRFVSLSLHEWGHFPMGTPLVFGQGGAGLQVVHGPNEAGKSTLLRAFTGALFGFDARSKDDVANDRQVGAEVRLADGETLQWRRVRHARPTADPALLRLGTVLATVDRDQWRQVFGFADVDLARGAGALASRPLAQALDPEVDPERARRVLDRAAEELHKPKGTKTAVAEAIRGLEGLAARRRDELVTPAAWQRLSEAVAEAEAHAAATGATSDTLARAVERLTRQLAARPLLLRRDRLLAERAACPPTEGVSAAAAAAYRAAARDHLQQGAELRAAESAVRAAAEQAAAIRVDTAVLERAGVIRELERDVRRLKDTAARLPAELALVRDTEETLRRELSVFLPALPLEEAARRGPDHRLLRRLEALAAERTTTLGQHAQAQARAERSAAQLEQRRAQWAEVQVPPWSEGLAEALLEATEGDLWEQLTRLSARLEPRAAEAERLLAATAGVAVADGLAARVSQLRPATWARAWGIERERRVKAADAARDRRNEIARARDQAVAELVATEAGGPLPSKDALVEARVVREASWARIRRGLLEVGSLSRLEVVSVVDRHEGLTTAADAVADALRDAADAVSRHTQAAAEKRHHEEMLAGAEAERAEAEAALRAHDAAWVEAWSPLGILPLDPASMERWIEDAQQWARAEGERAELAARLAEVAGVLAGRTERLRAALGALGLRPDGDHALLLARTREAQQAHRQAADRQQERADRLAEAELQHHQDSAEADRTGRRAAEAQATWRAALLAAGASQEDTDAELLQWPAAVDRRLGEVRAWTARRLKLEQEQEAVAACAAAARSGLGPLGPVPRGGEHEAVEAAARRLEAAERAHVEHEMLTARLADRESHRADWQRRVDETRAHLASLREGRAEAEWLPLAESAERIAALDAELAAVESALAGHRADHPAAVFDAEAVATDEVALRRLLEDTTAEAQRTREAHNAAQQALGRARTERDRIRPERTLADLVEEEHARRVALRADVADWLVTRLARRLVDRAVAERERDHLPQVVARASTLFAAITGGRYRAIDERAGGLVALLADGTARAPAELSDATRQQVFLAARLAWAEQHNRGAEPLPLVLDDVLSAFDEGRARVALGALADFAADQQVILLTHHAHVRDLAAALPGTSVTTLPPPRS